MTQSDLTQELVGLTKDLSVENVEYALCGAMALAFYGHARFTKDIDLLIRPEDRDKALEIARRRGFVIAAGLIPLGSGERFPLDLYRASKVIGTDLLMLDLLLVNPPLERVLEGRVVFEMEGQPLNVVSVDGLAEMKRLAGRRQDLVDLENLGFSNNARAEPKDQPTD